MWGFVVRDSDGYDVLAGSGRLNAVHDAFSVEGKACLATLRAATDEGISQVIIESDSTNLVSAIQTSQFDQAPDGVIFRGIREVLSLQFVSVLFSSVPRSRSRSCNQCAHELAQAGLVRDWVNRLSDMIPSQTL